MKDQAEIEPRSMLAEPGKDGAKGDLLKRILDVHSTPHIWHFASQYIQKNSISNFIRYILARGVISGM